jgi:hypothetical protein
MSSGSSGNRATGNKVGLQDTTGPLVRLERYVRSHDYRGVDPYDALNSRVVRSLPGKLTKVAATQLFVYSPIDLRGFLKVRTGRNPKAVALFLSAYCDMRRVGLVDEGLFAQAVGELVTDLADSRSTGYHGNCWGFNFDWQDITRYAQAGLPTVVVSSFVGNALLDLHDLTGDEGALRLAAGIPDFILNDLNVHVDGSGICFSYTPVDRQVVHNANMLAAALLARVAARTGRKDLEDLAAQAVDFTVAHQEADGSWAYSIDPATGKERRQIDFHQGFVIDALDDFIRYSGRNDARYLDALRRGARFFRDEQFDPSGRAFWRLPHEWPADIHHQAQGIATFAQLGEREPDMLATASSVASWTINHMQHPDGHFYYQNLRGMENRIAYMRWGQAWMMYALARFTAVNTAAVR